MPIETVLNKEWQEANFDIPRNDEIRNELFKELQGYSHTGVMFLPQNKEAMKYLKARIAAIESHDNALAGK